MKMAWDMHSAACAILTGKALMLSCAESWFAF